ncbi:galactose-1-epimerase [Leptothrix sp. BB-4]
MSTDLPTSDDPWAPARLYTLENAAGLRIQVLDHGATWVSCSVPMMEGSRRELLIGCASLADYVAQKAYLGATVGRYANRIRDSRCTVDGQVFPLAPNEGPNQLHGGPDGFDRRTWTVESHTPQRLVLSLVSPDGDQGWPGEVLARVSYTLGADLALEIAFETTTTRACPVNLTHHAYFNLDGDAGASTRNVLQHHLQILAPSWLPVGADLLPAGELEPVDDTGFDLRELRRLDQAIAAEPALQVGKGFDHAYALDPACADALRAAVRLLSSDGRVAMSLATDLPALQVYSGQGLAGHPARDGSAYPAYAGIALEPQYLPDSPNHPVAPPHWPDVVQRPGERRRHVSRLFFDVG